MCRTCPWERPEHNVSLIGLKTVGIKTVGIKTVWLEMDGLEMDGLEMDGLVRDGLTMDELKGWHAFAWGGGEKMVLGILGHRHRG